MHPAIAKFPSAQFYEGRLKDADNVASLRPPLGFPWHADPCTAAPSTQGHSRPPPLRYY